MDFKEYKPQRRRYSPHTYRSRRTKCVDKNFSEPYLFSVLNAEKYASSKRQNQEDQLEDEETINILQPNREEIKVTSPPEIHMQLETDENNTENYITTNETKESDSDTNFCCCEQEDLSNKNIILPSPNSERSKKYKREYGSDKKVPCQTTYGQRKMVPKKATYGQKIGTFKSLLLGYGWTYVGPPAVLVIILCIFIYTTQEEDKKEEVTPLRLIMTRIFGWTIRTVISAFNTILGIVLPDDTQSEEEDRWNIFK